MALSRTRDDRKLTVYLSGIAGTGMSSLAGLFSQEGHDVYGSDIHFYPPVDRILSGMNIKTFQNYDPANIPADVDLCIIGNVISRGNPEAEFILNRRIKFNSMAEALYKHFIRGNRSIVVAGTHGKTTIASLCAHLLNRAGLDPGFFIGGKPMDFNRNYEVGSGNYFVTEGDEYETSFFDRSSKFLKYFPDCLVLSALEYDHIDFFPNPEWYLKSFRNLVNQVPSKGVIICNADFPMNLQAVENSFSPLKTFGEKRGEYRIQSIRMIKGRYHFVLKHKSRKMEYRCPILGRHNIWNCCAAIILGRHLGLPERVIREAVDSFQGVERRMRLIREIGATLFIEDFAHHPTSIESLLRSLREGYPTKKIVALFEPRSWSLRRNIFQDRLIVSLAHADEIGIKDVFQKEKLPPDEVLNVEQIRLKLSEQGRTARVFLDYNEIRTFIREIDFSQDQLVVLISNGDFGNIPSFVRELNPG
jgi:UDP-N-acetylmuramate: L-alanyl-gamma-D-glutamyl-meso-diaminopimelate ligase